MANEAHCSSNPSQPRSSTPPPNAFTPEFLKALEAREDAPLAALEADSRGPWKVVRLPLAAAGGGGGGNGAVVGHFATWDQDVVAAMRVLSSLLRIPEALARVVDAGSAPVAELIGRRLVDG